MDLPSLYGHTQQICRPALCRGKRRLVKVNSKIPGMHVRRGFARDSGECRKARVRSDGAPLPDLDARGLGHDLLQWSQHARKVFSPCLFRMAFVDRGLALSDTFFNRWCCHCCCSCCCCDRCCCGRGRADIDLEMARKNAVEADKISVVIRTTEEYLLASTLSPRDRHTVGPIATHVALRVSSESSDLSPK